MRKFVFAFCVGVMAATSSPAQDEPYKNPDLSPQERADDLLKRLTLKEKISLMQNQSPGVERLGIKPYNWWSEALHGVARNGLATVYPITMGMASVFDDKLIEDIYVTVSDEGRAKFHDARRHGRYGRGNEGLTFWNPNVNIFRDPRWGRGQETWGEDPYLTTRMGVAVVRGRLMPSMTRRMPVPSIMLCTAVPRPNAILSMWKIWNRVIYGKRIFRLSRRWCKRRM